MVKSRKMSEWIIFIVIGLSLDACGAVLIINPLINLHHIHEYRKNKELQLKCVQETKKQITDYQKELEEFDSHYGYLDKLQKEEDKDTIRLLMGFDQEKVNRLESSLNYYTEFTEEVIENKVKHSAYFGLSLLLIGFALQIIANALQWSKI